MGLADLAVGEQLAQQSGGALLLGVRPRVVNAGVERIGCAADRLQAHRGSAVRRPPQRPGVVHEQRGKPRLRLGPVHEGEAFFRLERDGSRHFHVPFADHREGEMRQRGQVARRTHAALRRHPGMDPAVEHLDQQLRQNGTHAARTPRQDVGAE